MVPGEYNLAKEPVLCNEGYEAIKVEVKMSVTVQFKLVLTSIFMKQMNVGYNLIATKHGANA